MRTLQDPDELKRFAARLTRAIGELASLQSDLAQVLGQAEGVQAQLTGLFSQPVATEQVLDPLESYARPYPSVRLHFGFYRGGSRTGSRRWDPGPRVGLLNPVCSRAVAHRCLALPKRGLELPPSESFFEVEAYDIGPDCGAQVVPAAPLLSDPLDEP